MGTISSNADALVQEYLKKYQDYAKSSSRGAWISDAVGTGQYASVKNMSSKEITDQIKKMASSASSGGTLTWSNVGNVKGTSEQLSQIASFNNSNGHVGFSSGGSSGSGDLYSQVVKNLQSKVNSGELKKYNGSQDFINDYLSNYSYQTIDTSAYSGVSSPTLEYRDPSMYYAMYGVARPVTGNSWSYVAPDGTVYGGGWGSGNSVHAALYGPYPPTLTGNNINVALYGPYPPSTGNNTNVALYGVYRPPINNGEITISITEEEIKENVSILKKAANTMETAWEDIKGSILKSIKEAWTSTECDEYVSKIEKMDTKVTNSIEALRLLAKTYEKSIEQLTATTRSIKNAISSI